MATVLREAFAVYPSVKMKGFKKNSKTEKMEFVFLKELLFGDYIQPYVVDDDYVRKKITEGKNEVEYIKIRSRRKNGYIKESDMQAERILEINFVDVGQGDDEPYAHPRPDTLGTIGKHSRGERSLIFSTELARSGKEYIELQTEKSTEKKRERVVTVYGMINVRTDGEKVVIAQKLEKSASSKDWDIHKLEWNEETEAFEYNQYKTYE